MSAKHTRGPWYVNSIVEHEPGKRSRAVHNVFNQDGLLAHIAECGNEANARLIAASPTMHEYITRRAADGDQEAAAILESIHASR